MLLDRLSQLLPFLLDVAAMLGPPLSLLKELSLRRVSGHEVVPGARGRWIEEYARAHHKPWATGAVTAEGGGTANESFFASSGTALGDGWNPGHRCRKVFSSSPLSTRVRACRAR